MKLVSYCTFAALLTLPTAGLAEDPTVAPVTVQIGDELKRIREALDQLVAFQRLEEHYREVDLILKRIDVWTRRLAPLEQQLVGAEREFRDHEDHLRSLDRMEEQHRATLNEEIEEGTDLPRSETRRMLEDIERTRSAVEERIESKGLRIQQLENDLAEGRKAIEILDDRLIDLLDTDR